MQRDQLMKAQLIDLEMFSMDGKVLREERGAVFVILHCPRERRERTDLWSWRTAERSTSNECFQRFQRFQQSADLGLMRHAPAQSFLKSLH